MDYSFNLYGFKLRDAATFRAAVAALGLNPADLEYAKKRDITLYIKCTASQFGNFIAQRVLNGCRSNGIIELEVKALGTCTPPAPMGFNPNFDVR